jgi:uncharacterized membrane protein
MPNSTLITPDVPANVAKVLRDKRIMGFWACWGAFLATAVLVALPLFGFQGPTLLMKLIPLAVPLFRVKTVVNWNPAHRWARAIQAIVRVGFALVIGVEVLTHVALGLSSSEEQARLIAGLLGVAAMGAHLAVAVWGSKKLLPFRSASNAD